MSDVLVGVKARSQTVRPSVYYIRAAALALWPLRCALDGVGFLDDARPCRAKAKRLNWPTWDGSKGPLGRVIGCT